ncbi:MAG TPA: hypothetical protein VM735_08365 [Candidatus Kapabacteria bacterium]|nr:hypothetical protein [Candidatus Kapabacteria bacterium]
MKTRDLNIAQKREGFALLVVLGFTAISLIALGGALSWTAHTSRTTDRNNQYFNTVAAAEAATEKVVSKLSGDFQQNGIGSVVSGLPAYRNLVPTGAEDPLWNQFQFSNGSGTNHATHVEQIDGWGYTNLSSQYTGLKGYASTFRVISNARSTVPPIMTAAVKQEIQLASVPVFQFAIFYTMDLEINPGPVMNINGRVHSNGEIYTRPNASITYLDHVTAVRNINLFQSPLDPSDRPTNGTVTFGSEHDGRVSSLSLPIGTNNSPGAVHSVVEIPPVGESPTSLMGRQRYYNKADLVLIFSNSGITAKAGSTAIPAAQYNTFVSSNTSLSFYNMREEKTVRTIQVDIAAFKTFSEGWFRTQFGRNANCLYVADTRMLSSSLQSGIRLLNGHTLPAGGLTVATPNPLYVKGHYNSPSSPNYRGTANTSNTRPASLVGDAITILSQNWNDANGNTTLNSGSRNAADTTVNAAFLAGIVPSDGVHYSGGVENFPRFLENWSSRTFTYNGSMVVMFYSSIAKSPWTGTGVVYNPPNRNWAFDINFMDVTKLPPGTPQLLTMVRGRWAMLAPQTIL